MVWMARHGARAASHPPENVTGDDMGESRLTRRPENVTGDELPAKAAVTCHARYHDTLV